MNIATKLFIELAAETLDCEGHCAHGHYIYRDQPTGWWMVSDADMAALGRLIDTSDTPARAVRLWCDTSKALEVDLDLIVRDYEITTATDIDALISKCEAMDPPDIMTALVLRFARSHVLDTIRINAEIDRDREPEPDGPDWDEDNSFDWSDDGEATR
jgi:hypothetical protein